ncbi:hypothetical protein H206_02718 [Candidatus Electrothrix aarhusensis]|uniref:Uncharacterized protein n=1 Tax=Candidatus Electrothrix aarhusensis TaxID=1859131 RepID=A0A3S3U6W5_9BACT|nr:hypothetical protein H206_02718 [Candidatus Electrothrix aarhusensis]
MFNLQLHISPKTEQRLKAILAHAQDQETFAQNIISYQITELQKGIVNIRLDLKKFEEKYKQPTEEFYQQYTQGQTDDSEDAMLWAGLYEMLRDNENQLRELLPDTSPHNDLLNTWEKNLLKGGEPLLSEREQPKEQQKRDGLDEFFV